MTQEFETTRTELANHFATAGAALLDHMGCTAAVAAIPNTTDYAVAGSLAGILSLAGTMLPAAAVEKPTGDLTDEQILVLARQEADEWEHSFIFNKEDRFSVLTFARAIERAAIAAHLAKEPRAEQPAAWFKGKIDAGDYDREAGTMRITVKLPFAGLPEALLTIGANACISAAPVAQAVAQEAQHKAVPEEVAGVNIARLLRNLDETNYNEGAMDLACRLSDCRAVIKELLAAPGAQEAAIDIPPRP
jgi:hypothetical protein